MTKEKLIEELKKCELNGDTECAHSNADDLIIEYINDPEIKAAYDAVDKWFA